MKIRNKLIAALSMLIISALMLSTASYAWFTISTNPEIQSIQAQVVANENLEIALATSPAEGQTYPSVPTMDTNGETVAQENIEWGNLVDLDGAITVSTDLRPATHNGTKFQYPIYGEDGRIDSFADLSEQNTHPYGNLTGSRDNVDNNVTYGYYIEVWFRTNVEGDLKFSAAADRGAGTNGAGSTFIVSGVSDADKVFADNIQIATKVIASQAASATSPSAVANSTIVKAAMSDPTQADSKTTVNISSADSTKILTMEANTAYLVRIYVWLEGANVTNAAAPTSISGTLNLQFAISDVDNPMDVGN